MTWLEKAQALEGDYTPVGTLLFLDALRMALREELDFARMMHKKESRQP
jgi:hypothetical protein